MAAPVTTSSRRLRVPAALMAAAALLAGAAALQLWAGAVDRVDQPISITACTPADYTDGVCDERHRPGIVELADDLVLQVAGAVCSDADRDIPYIVEVAWVDIATGARIPALVDVPVTWNPGCSDYAIDWVPPAQLLALADTPGESLGRWKIAGVAHPVDPTRYATYQWDSVATFELVTDK